MNSEDRFLAWASERPAPNPHAIFRAVSGSRPRSAEYALNTAAEQVNLLMKHRYASSDFVMIYLKSNHPRIG